ncbi:lymphocyte cytosolic protein 2-like isoform X1 [Hylaeus volcanicus]|uniref:lymphocyte cytosolic protein 2-like isoform X1 n=1 Tax=Hylaeus volcanicus TaxID=313075 RepID=UPI0023B7C742|nr:lymphocyte cytosolic protein 2-like isoform X1 [Hylaeus volcanicus]
MFKKLSQINALEDISNWTTSDVLCLLRKNGLEECCKAIATRQIDGNELLQLTEGQLALWKSDLTRPLIWSLWAFIEEVRKTPEKFVEEKNPELHGHEDHFSDTGSWGTDFEDDTNEEVLSEDQKMHLNPGFRASQRLSRDAAGSKRKDTRVRAAPNQEDEGTYANCGPIQDDENTYANCQESRTAVAKNPSRLHSQIEKSLAEQLKEQLQLRNSKKPMIVPKPESLQARRIEVTSPGRGQPQKSFLHHASKAKANVPSQTQKRMAVPPPPEPKKTRDQTVIIERTVKDQTKPPATLRNLDLVANLPSQTEESEDEYESFDEQIIEQNQKRSMLSATSKQSLTSGRQTSAESIYQPPSISSFEDEELQCEIYESITETPDDNGYYLNSTQTTSNTVSPPLLLAKPAQSSASPSPTSSWSSMDKSKERSPEKKSTLPHSNSNTSLSSERATRPLPPPPERHSYIDKPWFHNVTREQATALIKEQNTYGNPQDGYFLLRPSTTNVNNPLALVLWYNDRVYNVPVRKRPDNRYALGSAKTNEQSFSSVEEIVMFYTREGLVLHSNGVQMGSTKLTDTPPK